MVKSRKEFQNPDCYARGLGECSAELSAEHGVSEAVLRTIAGKGQRAIEVRGFPWLKAGSRRIGIKNMVSKVLCKFHNESISHLDSEANTLFRVMDSINAHFLNGINEVYQVNGHHLERWMLKALCAAVYSGNTVDNKGKLIHGWQPSMQWQRMIFKGTTLPPKCGLYFACENEDKAVTPSLAVFRFAPLCDDKENIFGLRTWIHELEFLLVMEPSLVENDNRFIFRPTVLSFRDKTCEKRLRFKWVSQLNEIVIPLHRIKQQSGT